MDHRQNVYLQDGNEFSLEQFAYYNGIIPSMMEFTICYWEYIKYFNLQGVRPFTFCYAIDENAEEVLKCTAIWSDRNKKYMGSKVINLDVY